MRVAAAELDVLVDELLPELDSDADETELEIDAEAIVVLSARTEARIESANRAYLLNRIILNIEPSINQFNIKGTKFFMLLQDQNKRNNVRKL